MEAARSQLLPVLLYPPLLAEGERALQKVNLHPGLFHLLDKVRTHLPWSFTDCSTPLRYGSNLVSVSSFRQNNFTGELAQQQLQTTSPEDAYWLGYQTQNELQTNTLASASGSQISQYYGHWAQEQPDTNDGRCVEALLPEDPRRQQWALTRCETLLPFMCQIQVCLQAK